MAEHTRPVDSNLEQLLTEYGREVAYPPLPDIASAVEQSLIPNGRPHATDHQTFRLAATPPGNTSPSPSGSASVVLDRPAQSGRSRQMLELVAGLLIFALIAAALAIVFRGFDSDSASKPGAAPGSLVENFDLYMLEEHNNQIAAIPLNRDTLANRLDLPMSGFDSDSYVHFSKDGSTRVEVDYPPDANSGEGASPDDITITVSDGLTNDVIASFNPPADVVAPRLSDDGSRLVLSTRFISGEPNATDWYVLDTATGDVLSHLHVDDVSESRYEIINSGVTRLYRVVPPPSATGAVEPGPLELVGYDLTTGQEFARVVLPEIPAGFWHDESGDPESDLVYRAEPGIVISPDDQRLAVISADATLVVLLDAETLEVERSIDLAAENGRIDRLLGWLNLIPEEVEAKDLIGPSRQAVYHPDGQYLYSYGIEGVEEGRIPYRSLGLTLVDMEDGEVAAEALPGEDISWLTPAPDGKSIYVGGFGERTGNGAIFMDSSPFIIRRLDATTLEVLSEREFDGYRRIMIDPSPGAATEETTDNGNALDLLRADLQDDEQGLEMLPVNAATHEPLTGYQPIDLGHHYTHAFSPDGRTMAAFVWPVSGGGRGEGGKLYLVDLVDWTVTDSGVRVDQNTGHLLFSEDGNALYWTLYTTTDPAHGMPRDYELHRFDLETGTQETVARFPESFSPGELRLFHDGTRLAIWGVPVDPNNVVEGPPQVMIVNLERDEIVADVEVLNLKAWQHQEIDGGEVSYRIYRPGLAWDLQRELLYIAHPDEDRVSVVDLAEGALKTQSAITQPQSLLDQFFGWLVQSAAAKGNPTTTKTAVLSGDGERLFMAGTHEEFAESSDGSVVRTDGADLLIVDTEGIEEIGRLDLGAVVGMQTGPDGRYLYVRSYERVANHTGHRLTKLDMETGEVVAQLELPDRVAYSLNINGKIATVRYQRSVAPTRLEEAIIDLDSFEILEQRALGEDWFADTYLHPSPD